MSTRMIMLVPHFAFSQLPILICHILLNTQENKCKLFEIILLDLKGNCCEIIAFVCLHMFFGVSTINITIVTNEKVICITSGMQTNDDNVSKELGFDKSKGEDEAETLNVSEILLFPPPIDNSKASYVKRKKGLQDCPTPKIKLLRRRGRKKFPC
jgi:hypothetical protein